MSIHPTSCLIFTVVRSEDSVMRSTPSPTKELGEFASKLQYKEIPPEVILKAKYLLLDYLGGMIPGNREEMAQILFRFVQEVSGPSEAHLLGTGEKVGAQWAALYNGAVGHLIDMDDIHWGSVTHAGVCIWAAALAMGEKLNSSGEDILTAAIAGYEVALRIGYAVEPDHYVRGFNPSGTIMTFGAAAVAARLLNLDPLKTTHALGMAGVMTAGNRAHLTERVMTKDYNSGFSPKSGVLAALLAAKGFTASTDELENPLGFLHVYGDKTHPEALTRGLREIWHILETGQKLYPACRAMHSSIDAILALRSQINPMDVDRVTTKIFATGANIVDDACPWSGAKGIMGARFSAQFNMAVAFLYGKDGLWDLYDAEKSMSYMKEDRIRALVGRIELIHMKEWDRDTSKYSACETSIVFKDGRRLDKSLGSALGDPDNPIPYNEQEIRFRRLMEVSGWDHQKITSVMERVKSLEQEKTIEQFMNNF